MSFQDKGKFLREGVEIKVDVYIPSFMMEYDISEEIWEKAISDFNEILFKRSSPTCKVKGINVDILKVESGCNSREYLSIGAIMVYMVVKSQYVNDLLDIHFILSGTVSFEDDHKKIIKDLILTNITYGGNDSKKYKLLG